MERFENLTLDAERALYGLNGAEVVRCVFDGPADGESALKECRNITLTDCDLRLRYPLWHVSDAVLTDCRMTDTCRAALWYDDHLALTNCELGGIKALRECRSVTIEGGSGVSTEFGWMCHDLRIRDFALVRGNGTITSEIAKAGLDMLEIDSLGLDNTDRRMLEAIIRYYDGGPVGLETLAATTGEEAITIEDVYEPYLLQIGFINRTPRGRCVTRLAYEHLGIRFNGSGGQISIDDTEI